MSIIFGACVGFCSARKKFYFDVYINFYFTHFVNHMQGSLKSCISFGLTVALAFNNFNA